MSAETFVVILLSLAVIIISVSMKMLVDDFREVRRSVLKLEAKAEQTEPQICDFCRYYNSNIPCGSTPSACKEADKFAEEFVDGLKKLKPKDEPQTDCAWK